MANPDSEQPSCPMCGSAYEQPVRGARQQMVSCAWCGERFQVRGRPEAGRQPFRRPFWTDQFRMYRDDASSEHLPAAIDGFMLFIAVVCAVFVLVVMLLAAMGYEVR